MLSCRHATGLASLALERPLTFRERLALRGHLLICSSCRRAQRQFRIMRELMRSAPDAAPSPQAAAGAMPEDVRERLSDTGRGADEDRG